MKLNKIIVKCLLFILLFFLNSCSNVSCPSDSNIVPGINGIVRDTLGNPLENVSVFCLFNYSYIPNESIQKLSKLKVLTKTDFGFNLEQNFPNPFSNSTFFRFSLPDSSFVNFKIVSGINNKVVFQFSKELPGGYFQYYLKNLVDSLNLQNGAYYYTLNVKTNDGLSYSDSKKLFIISDKGEPNSKTDFKGYYAFNYKNAFVGDSLIIKYSEDDSYSVILTNSLCLLFKKDGYYSKTIYVTLYPDLTLTNDVVLIRK